MAGHSQGKGSRVSALEIEGRKVSASERLGARFRGELATHREDYTS